MGLRMGLVILNYIKSFPVALLAQETIVLSAKKAFMDQPVKRTPVSMARLLMVSMAMDTVVNVSGDGPVATATSAPKATPARTAI